MRYFVGNSPIRRTNARDEVLAVYAEETLSPMIVDAFTDLGAAISREKEFQKSICKTSSALDAITITARLCTEASHNSAL